ncbi:hypothetical protein T484DRAFT_1821934 [Baffinella frigidus]|nr:hypothetical protein T484DRAFT_1821934 [Cryptophyta sp. CCMP2293]
MSIAQHFTVSPLFTTLSLSANWSHGPVYVETDPVFSLLLPSGNFLHGVKGDQLSFHVSARNHLGGSAPSSQANVTILGLPTPPLNQSVWQESLEEVRLKWSDPLDHGDGKPPSVPSISPLSLCHPEEETRGIISPEESPRAALTGFDVEVWLGEEEQASVERFSVIDLDVSLPANWEVPLTGTAQFSLYLPSGHFLTGDKGKEVTCRTASQPATASETAP